MMFQQDDPKVHAVVDKLLDVLNTPSEAVQRAVSSCLSPLMKSKQVFHKQFCGGCWDILYRISFLDHLESLTILAR